MKTLQEQAVRVKPTIRQWSAKRYDKKESKELNDRHNTKDAARVNKVLIPLERLKAIKKAANQGRITHYHLTSPYAAGYGIIANKLLPRYFKKMTALKTEFDKESTAFIREYPEILKEAPVVLNSMYNPNDYPSVHEIGDKFKFDFFIEPIPETGHFIIDFQERMLREMQVDVDTRLTNAIHASMKHTWNRLYEVAKKLTESLKDEDKRFFESNVTNITELCDILPDLNFAEDSNLDDLSKELKEKAESIVVDTVKIDKKYRRELANDVKETLDKMEAYL